MRSITYALVVATLMAVSVAGVGRLASAQSDSDTVATDRPDADYVGQIYALTLLETTTGHNITGLIEAMDAGWPQLKWQNDIIGQAAVFNAVSDTAKQLKPPARFADAHKEFLLAFEANSTYGTTARAAVEAGDPPMLQNATTNLQQANDHLAKANSLLQAELATGA
ncbi:MAG TPA: hypothetical protein VFX03_14145 [Thermomicrobiales bacterium]|nr:hypothetical protein [Thermomicrobiales bacterium]